MLAVATGLLVGMGLGLGVELRWAEDRVREWLADPPRESATVVWSASSTLRVGQAAEAAAVVADLRAAGFALGTGPLRDRDVVHSGPDAVRWWPRDGVAASIRLIDGRIVATTPKGGAPLPPTVLATVGDPERQRAPLARDARGTWLPQAVIAMEDTRFYRHPGIDAIGLLRAAGRTALGRRQGGSTLTQQLAKNLFTGSVRSVHRKVEEGVLALALERVLDKESLLGLYLGEVYLGQAGGRPLYGVDAAARTWFGVAARDVDVVQAALIAGVIPSPNAWNPVDHPDQALARRQVVLNRLSNVGLITASEAVRLGREPLGLRPVAPARVRLGGYAVAAALAEARERLGVDDVGTGRAIRTAIDPTLQRAAEQSVRDGLASLSSRWADAGAAQAALVALRPTDGAVVAWVGGTDWGRAPFDRARHAAREAGSTVKSLLLLEALDRGLVTADTLLDDAPLTRRIDGHSWSPQNFDGAFLGPITVRDAISGSRNVPAVLLAESIGGRPLQDFFRSVGLTSATPWPSAALGAFSVTPVALAGAWTALLDGEVRSPRLLLGVADAHGDRLVDVPVASRRVASAAAAAAATDVLRDVLVHGTGRGAAALGVGPEAAAKTGTTDDGRDAWMAGHTRDLVVVVWVGLDEGTLGRTGAEAALPVWARMMSAAGPPSGPLPRVAPAEPR